MLTSISCVCVILFDSELPTAVLILAPKKPSPALAVTSALNVLCSLKVPPNFAVVVS
jgi:hypothetical protein